MHTALNTGIPAVGIQHALPITRLSFCRHYINETNIPKELVVPDRHDDSNAAPLEASNTLITAATCPHISPSLCRVHKTACFFQHCRVATLPTRPRSTIKDHLSVPYLGIMVIYGVIMILYLVHHSPNT